MPLADVKRLKDPPPMGPWEQKWFDFTYWWKYRGPWSRLPTWALRPFWKIERFWHGQVTTRIWPRQAWLTKALPREWCDLVELIPTMLYASIINYVEGEDCFNTIVIEGAEAQMIKTIYNWAKWDRAAFQQKIMDAYPESRPRKKGESISDWLNHDDRLSYEEMYGEVNRLEAEFEKWDTEYLRWIVTNRATLWT